MTTENHQDEGLAPIVVTHDGVTHDALTDAVRRTVKTMRFEPAVSGGPNSKPRTEEVQISYVFASSPT